MQVAHAKIHLHEFILTVHKILEYFIMERKYSLQLFDFLEPRLTFPTAETGTTLLFVYFRMVQIRFRTKSISNCSKDTIKIIHIPLDLNWPLKSSYGLMCVCVQWNGRAVAKIHKKWLSIKTNLLSNEICRLFILLWVRHGWLNFVVIIHVLVSSNQYCIGSYSNR